MNHAFIPGCRNTVALALALTGLFAAGLLPAKPAEKEKPKDQDYTFFPPAPDEPHLQFLTGFSSEAEMGRSAKRSFTSWLTGKPPPRREINKPYGAAVRNNILYICDTEYGAVLKADFKTKKMSLFKAKGMGFLNQPVNLAIDQDGTMYVADSARNQVVVYDKDENYLAVIGKHGEIAPRDVVVGVDKIYIADIKSHNIQVYDKSTRNPLYTIPKEADAKEGKKRIVMPTNLALDAKGRLYVSDTGAFRIQVYDDKGDYLRTVGEMGDSFGQFARNKGIAVDREFRLYATDSLSQVTQIFNEQGQVLTWFGEPVDGSAGPAGMKVVPAKVLLDYEDVGWFESSVAPGFKVEYLIIVINQVGPHLVSIYGFGHPK